MLMNYIPAITLAQDKPENSINPYETFLGSWKIDLRPTPESEAYFQAFMVTTINENSFSGTFYGSEIKDALTNNNWPKFYFAFTTLDQNNEYFHSGYLENDKIYGITYCPNRDFTSPWIGIKE